MVDVSKVSDATGINSLKENKSPFCVINETDFVVKMAVKLKSILLFLLGKFPARGENFLEGREFEDDFKPYFELLNVIFINSMCA